MTRKLAEMEYDFSRFTVDDLIQTLANRRQTRIVTVPVSMPSYMFGAWMRQINPTKDYIFYDRALSPHHKAHTILHEVGHWWCQHGTLEVDFVTLRQLITLLDSDVLTVAEFWEQLTKRAKNDREEPEEIEAEMLALLIQNEAQRHKRWQDLKGTGAADKELRTLLVGLGLLE